MQNSYYWPGRLSALASVVVLAVGIGFAGCHAAVGQDTSGNGTPGQRIQNHLRFGEFSSAIQAAGRIQNRQESDRWLSEIARRQQSSGAYEGSFETMSQISNDQTRGQALYGAYENLGNRDSGAGGGITAADFTELIQLIQSTIQPDTWSDVEGNGTIRAYPAGVYVDAKGTMKRLKTSSNVDWQSVRNDLKTADHEASRWNDDGFRKISITKLENQLQMRAARGLKPTEQMQHLGGIYEIKYLLFYPETHDVVIAGPAGPWRYDNQGRALNVKSGKPVLLLDDLVVCLRNAFESDGVFGCSIDPTEDNLKATQSFLSTSKLQGEPWRRALRNVVGNQVITVHGIDRQSHASRIIVESDYRMKLVGMGLEDTILEVPSYLDRVKLDAEGNPPPMDLARWWFTLNYESVLASEQRDAFQFKGHCVKLESESEMLNNRGERVHTGKSSPENEAFARDFTQHFDKMSKKYPIYAELKNVFDLALVAALIRHEDINGQLQWQLNYFGTPSKQRPLTYSIARDQVAKEVQSVMNFREINVRKGSKRIKHTIVGVSGGVEFEARKVVDPSRIKIDASLSSSHQSHKSESGEQQWWWD